MQLQCNVCNQIKKLTTECENRVMLSLQYEKNKPKKITPESYQTL